jgi:predicted ATPase
VVLNRLGERDGSALVERLAGNAGVPSELVAEIVERSDGVPLFIEELTKAVVETGADRGDLTVSGAPAVPATLHASLLGRLDRLGPAAKMVAQAGAAIGRGFSYDLVAAAAELAEPELQDALRRLVGSGLVFQRGMPPASEYLFKHALVQDAAYSTLLRSRRQQLHGSIAATLEDRFPEIVRAQPALLAHHSSEAGLPEKAVDYWLTAGRQAWSRSAAAEAVALLRRGLAAVPALPETDRRREIELDLQIALGHAMLVFRGWGAPDAGEAYSRARTLASVLNRPRAVLSALWGQWRVCWARADLKRARQLADEMAAFGEMSGDLPARVLGYDAGGFVRFYLGDFATGRVHLEKALALYDPAHRVSYSELLPNDALVQLWTHSAYLLASLGYLDQALLQRDAAVDEARRLSHPLTLAIALGSAWWLGSIAPLDPGSMLQIADELLELATEHGIAFHRTSALVQRGWCLVALGSTAEGIPLLTAGIAGWDEIGLVLNRPWLLTLLGDASRIAGQYEAALAHMAEGRRLAEETQERWAEAEMLRLTGDVLLATGNAAAAEASYREALAVAQLQSAKLWELRGAISLARLWRDQGKRIKARDLLAPVYGWFTEGFGTPVLQEAKALLAEVSV